MKIDIDAVTKCLRYNIPNEELFYKIFNELINYYENHKLKIISEGNNVLLTGINKKDKKDFLSLRINPGTIDFSISRWNGHNQEQLTIIYTGYKTIIFDKELTNYVYSYTKNISSTYARVKKKTYINGELVFESELTEEIGADIYSKVTFDYTETNRINKNTALKVIASLENHNKISNYQISYDYDELYYDDKKNKQNVYINRFKNISSEEYYELLNGKQKTIKK